MQRNTNKLNNVNIHKNFPFVLNVNCLKDSFIIKLTNMIII